MKRWCRAAFLLLLAAVSCSQKEIVPQQPQNEPRLRSVTVSVESLILPEKGSALLPFSVKDQDYVFDQIRLLDTRGEAIPEVTILGFMAESVPGNYSAALEVANPEADFELSACLTIVQRNPQTGTESFVSSEPFVLQSAKPLPAWAQTGLPVVYVETEGGKAVTSKTEEVPAVLHIQDNQKPLEETACSIRGRGNTTWEWPKKPYLIKLKEKTSVLGLPKHKRWVLLANFMDRTLMRNLVSMHVASMTSLAWTPRCVPVELVLNGEHQGSYLLIEQVRIDKNRVNISEEEGWLLELDFHYDNTFQWKERNIPFAVKNPDPDELTDAQKSYIKSYIKEVSDVIYGSGFADASEGYAKYLDVDSFIDYWIVFEVMCNHELGNPGSVYFHKDKDGLLTAGPCWDFDWGVLSFYTSNGANGLVNGKAIWYARLFQDPVFKERVKARYMELLPQLETIPDYMDQCEQLLKKSAELNFAMWNPAEDRSMNNGQIINGDENLSFHDAITRLKTNYRKHLQVIRKSL